MVTSNNRKAAGLVKNLRSLRCRVSKLFISSKSDEDNRDVNLLQPPFPHLLRSNTPPTEREASLIREVIVIAEVEESRLTEMISNRSDHTRLESRLSLKDLKNKFDYNHQFIVEHRSILSTIRHIPPEILEVIFTHTLPPTPPSMHRVSYNSELPWALSQVCRLWRITILSLSVMWRDFPVIDLSFHYTKTKPYLDFLHEMLKRSGNTPIRLSMTGHESIEQISHPALDLLVLHSDRWQKLRIQALPFLPSFQKIKGRLTSLQSLHLHLCFGGLTAPIHHTAHDLFRVAPQLQYVDIMEPTGEFIFPTHQLVHYCQSGTSLNQAIQVISSSPSLRKLQFYGLQSVDDAIPTTVIMLPGLTVLDAYIHPLLLFHEALFSKLTIPAIEELRIESIVENAIRPIRSMISRSGSPCLLKILHLHVPLAPGELSSLLSLTPLLIDLDTTLPSIQDISALIFDGNTAPLVPFLDQCIFLSWDDLDPPYSVETISALNLFASSRCDFPDYATSTKIQPSGVFHPLKLFCLDFGSRSNWYRRNFHYFEGWVHGVMADELRKQRDCLVAIFPVFTVRWHDPFKRRFNLKWKNEVIDLLTHLETLQVENASDIYISEIYPIIHMISTQVDMESSFRLIAEHILEKWEPILRRDMRNIRWLLNDLSLIYLSRTQSHVLCSSPDAMRIFFDGFGADGI